MTKAYISKQIDDKAYKANVLGLDIDAQTIRAFSMAIRDDLQSALAADRIMLRDMPLLGEFYKWLNADKYPNLDSEARKKEMRRLLEEVSELGNASRKRIESISRNLNSDAST